MGHIKTVSEENKIKVDHFYRAKQLLTKITFDERNW